MRTLFVGLLCGWLWSVAGQAYAQTDEQLAMEYFRSGDCEKAMTFHEKILRKNFDRRTLKNYTSCLIKTKSWAEADKFFKRQTRSNSPDLGWYYANWGQLLEAKGEKEEAEKRYSEAIVSFGPRFDLLRELSDEFRELQKPEWAEQCIQKARVTAKNENLYRLEMASIYREMNNLESMVDELLSYGILFRNTEVVQSMLQDFLKEEKEQAMLEKVLYDKIQRNPNEPFYNELLVWYQVQRKDFYKAFIQERALDKRFKYGGSRIYDLANLAVQNQDYENAISMYEYIVKEYPQGQLYAFAKRLSINAREELVKTTYPINREEVRKLIAAYENLTKELGRSTQTLEALRSMAILHAFYLDDRPQAIKLLEQAISSGQQEKSFVDKCKLDLGDIYILENDPWEATLLYSQVEKSQKEELLGYDAKLRNAKLHYFKGDFELSKEILDILKKATTREIANDANALGLLIMDNIGLDSNETAMKAYANVELLLFQNKLPEAIDSLKSLYTQYKDHSLADEILWLLSTTYLKLDQPQQAVERLQVIVEKHYYDVLGDDALFTLAKVYEERVRDKEEAMNRYRELMEKYPGSIYVVEARKRYRALRGDSVN